MDVFKRYETKYLVPIEMVGMIKKEFNNHNIKIDSYGKSTIQSLYFDTSNDLLVTRSLEHPLYKEKLRLRCYGKGKPDSKLFLEIKKKSLGVVYKRRIETNYNEVYDFINNYLDYETQIGHELNYFRDYYKNLRPKILIIYDREAYIDSSSDLRITFDYDIRYRDYDLKMSENFDGTKINSGYVLMEIKTSSSYPLWLCNFLSNNHIFKNSFSKYGYAYLDLLKNKEKGENLSWKTYSIQSLAMAM